jgi:DNA (cytosine-5)-methyltransferase 1
MITFGSLFAGIGGIDLGLERAGMICKWQVEIDDYCNKVLKKHWPDVERFDDVRKVGKHNLESVDLIAGGFPCQPHSVAGKRRGAADDRNLWPEFIRIIRETKPRYVLAENVPGIISTYLDTVLSDLESEGYTARTFNLPAVAFDAPHRRERIFIVAYSECRGCSTKRQSRELERIQGKGQDNTSKIEESSDVADAEEPRLEGSNTARPACTNGQIAQCPQRDWWTVEPDVGRVAHGIPNRVDRLRGLGNAAVPQVAEWIGRRIIEFDE